MRKTLILLASLALVGTACGNGGAATTAAPTTESPTIPTTETTPVETTTVPATSTTAAEVGVEVTVAESALGLILVDGEGRTLYLFTPDAQGTPTCVDACANTWPPLVGTATAGEGVDGTLLGTIARADGSEQVTHNGWPLYRYSRDSGPGDTNGQGFNDVWFVVSPTGEAITG